MGQFLTQLDKRLIQEAHETGNGRPLYQLLAPLHYASDLIGLVIVPEGTRTDLASVPRWILTWLVAGGYGAKPAVIHDYLLGVPGITRKEADRVFREALYAIRLPAWRAEIMYAGVRIGAMMAGAKSAPSPARNDPS